MSVLSNAQVLLLREAFARHFFEGPLALCDSHEKLRGRVEMLEDALRRLIGAVEACAVAERGGPAVNWEAVDASQDSARELLSNKVVA